jgi:hypothetical protein
MATAIDGEFRIVHRRWQEVNMLPAFPLRARVTA